MSSASPPGRRCGRRTCGSCARPAGEVVPRQLAAVVTGAEMSASEVTPAAIWQSGGAGTIADALLACPPEVLALADVILERSEASRFALSQPDGEEGPPAGATAWPDAV